MGRGACRSARKGLLEPNTSPARQAARWLLCCCAALLCLALGSAWGIQPGADSGEEWRRTEEAIERDARGVEARQTQALREARARGDKPAMLKALNALTVLRAMQALTGSHLEDERQGRALAQELGDAHALIWYESGDAWLAAEAGRIEEAKALWERLVARARQLGLRYAVAMLYLDQATALAGAGRKADAMDSFGKAYEASEAIGYQTLLARVFTGIGKTYGGPTASDEDQARAVEYLSRSVDIVEANGWRVHATEARYYRGLAYLRRNDHERARRDFEAAIAHAQAAPHPQWEAPAQLHLGIIDAARHDGPAALQRMDRARELLSRAPLNVYLVMLHAHRAELLATLGRQEDSLAAIAQGRRALADAPTPANRAYFLPRAANALATMGRHAEAVTLLNEAREADRALAQAMDAQAGAQHRARLEFRLKEAENTALRSQQRESRSRQLALALALLLALVVLAWGGWLLRRRTQAARLRAQRLEALAQAERARAEAQAARAEAEAAANRAKTAFLANMSHELRSPLNAMLGFSRLLLRDAGLGERARHDVGIVLSSGEHLYALINQVLELSKVESGRMSLQPAAFDVLDLLEELDEMFSLAAARKGIGLRMEAAAGLPRRLEADVVKLRQVLVNLLSNAIKFTEHGHVALRVRLHDGRLGVEVQDTGVGIAPDELARLGEPFVQAEAGRQAAEGTGLGLAISRGFVHLMGGELLLSSRPGEGTAVRFDVPVKVLDEVPDAAAPVPARRVTGLAPGTPAPRVLAVDDWPQSRELLVRLLQPLGFAVREAADGQEALRLWQEWSPDLVLMDMRMPVMDGREATARIRAAEPANGRRTVIVALTASSFEEQRQEILAAGCDDFLRKPFPEDALLALIGRHLGLEFVYADAAAEPPRHAGRAAPAHAAGVSPDLRERLQAGLARLDVEAVERALQDVRLQDPATAEALEPLIERFDYEGAKRVLDATAA